MAGIYLHIPFCKSKCYYCDFYSSQDISITEQFISSLLVEIEQKNNYLISDKNIETIYFGGGTPSVLNPNQLKKILSKIHSTYNVSLKTEITIELNPDDITEEYLEQIYEIGINRLSIGLQSFSNEMLKLMNRRHNSEQAINSVKIAKKLGFKNISVDLIYGLPDTNVDFLKKELQNLIDLDIQHISAYHLTYEDKTVFKNYLKKGKLRELPDTESQKQFVYLTKFFEDNGFEQYEISNFAKNNLYSKHNSNYWFGVEYIGLGPSARSYNKDTRQWNIANVKKYIAEIESNNIFFEKEYLTVNDKYNEYLLTSLRTKWGVDLGFIKAQFGDTYLTYFISSVDKYVKLKYVYKQKNIVYLHKYYWFLSDKIISELMKTI